LLKFMNLSHIFICDTSGAEITIGPANDPTTDIV
jgi:hypothetical protein